MVIPNGLTNYNVLTTKTLLVIKLDSDSVRHNTAQQQI